MPHKTDSIKYMTLSSIIGLCFGLLAPNAMASGSNVSTFSPGAILEQIQQAAASMSGGLNALGDQIQQLSLAQQQSENSYRYQNDPQLINISNNTLAANTASQTAAQTASALSSQDITQALQPMSDASMETSTSGGVAVNDQEQASNANDRLNALSDITQDYSWGTTASDTLFANFNFTPSTNSNYKIDGNDADPVYQGQPTLHDSFFDFANFIQPTSLNYNDTPGGLESAEKFIQFLTNNYDPTYNQLINLNDLNSKITQANSSDTTGNNAASIIRYLTTSKDFQKAQMVVRQATAAQSVSLYTLNNIQAERQAIVSKDDVPQLDTIAQNMGIEVGKDSSGNYIYPSKAQISYYQTHHDLNDETWYQNLKTLSGRNVERETLITLKQIQQSLQQQHQDNQTIEALLAVSNIQGNQQSIVSLAQTKQNLANWIKNLDPSSPTAPQDSSTNSLPAPPN